MPQKPTIQAFSDEQLLQKYRFEDDNVCLEELFRRHIRFVFLVCMKYLRDDDLAKDISMQVFEKLLTDLKKFEIENFKSWLHSVVRNTCLMHIRSSKSVKFLTLDGQNVPAFFVENSTEMHPLENDHREIKLDQLEKAISNLESDQKKCVELFYFQEKSYQEVADITGFSMNQVKSHIQNGKRNLKNYLVSQGNLMVWVFVCLYFNS